MMPTARASHIAGLLFATALLVVALGSIAIRAESPGTAVEATSDATRLVILLEKPVEPQLRSLTNPNRVIIDLEVANASFPNIDKQQGLVRSVTGGVSGPNKFRVIVNLAAPVIVDKPRLEKPTDGKLHRLVLDFTPASSLTLAAVAKQAPGHGKTLPTTEVVQPPVPQPAQRPKDLAKRAHKDVIVIDPGHGGHDTGASRNGTVEKEVVLAFSKTLRDKLVATGRYQVFMTRETDEFISLDDRRQFAEQKAAALFIAVHADYAQSAARGATIYSLREAVAESLKRSAKSGGASDVLTSSELERAEKSGEAGVVKNWLAELATRGIDANRERTSVFSQSVVETLSETTNMHGNPEREAAFRVLKTARLPSVLIELGFVTNEQDAKLLRSEEWRSKVAASIMAAIDNYFSHRIARVPM